MVLILDGKTALEGARDGIELCIRTVIPSLFPFFVLSNLLQRSLDGVRLFPLYPIGRLCGLPDDSLYLLVAAFLGGYPVGARCVADTYRTGSISKAEAERLLGFCSNVGPAFLFGMISALFPSLWMVWVLWFIHIFSALITAALIPAATYQAAHPARQAVLPESSVMSGSLHVMATVCGWVVLFRILIAYLSRWFLWLLPLPAQVLIIGLLELTNGCCQLAAIGNIHLRFVMCAVFISLGGLCVTMQTMALTDGLSLRTYLLGKLSQALFSLVLSALFLSGGILSKAIFAGVIFFLLIKTKNRDRNHALAGV